MTQDTDTQPTAPAVDDFAHLEAHALMLEADNAPPPPPGTPEPVTLEQTAAELEGALQMVRMMVAPAMAWWPQFGECWSDRALTGIAQGGAAVMEKHGWTMGEMLTAYGPYIALIGATLPPSLVTYQAFKARKEAAHVRRPQQTET